MQGGLGMFFGFFSHAGGRRPILPSFLEAGNMPALSNTLIPPYPDRHRYLGPHAHPRAPSWPYVATAGRRPGLRPRSHAVGVTKLKVRPAVAGTVGGLPAVRAGGLVKVAATLFNTGPTELRHVTLRLQLPNYLVPKHTSEFGHGHRSHEPQQCDDPGPR